MGKYTRKKYRKSISNLIFETKRYLAPKKISDNPSHQELYKFVKDQLRVNFRVLHNKIKGLEHDGLKESQIIQIANQFNSVVSEYCMARKAMEEKGEREDEEEEEVPINTLHQILRELDDISSKKEFFRSCIFEDLATLEKVSRYCKEYFLEESKSKKNIQKGMVMCLKKNFN